MTESSTLPWDSYSSNSIIPALKLPDASFSVSPLPSPRRGRISKCKNPAEWGGPPLHRSAFHSRLSSLLWNIWRWPCFQEGPPLNAFTPSPSKPWSLALCSLLLHIWESLCFSDFCVLQYQVQSPSGPRRRLLWTKPSLIKSPPHRLPSPGPRQSLAEE